MAYDDPLEELDQAEIDNAVEEIIDQEDSEVEAIDADQRLLLTYLTASDELWTKAVTIMKPAYFDGEYRAVATFVLEYFARYKRLPNRSFIKAKTGVRLDDPTDHTDQEVQQFICDQFEGHCRLRAAESLAIRIADIIGEGKREKLLPALKEAENITQIAMHRELGFEVHESMKEKLAQAEERDNISTGFSLLDRAFGGGITRPSFNLVSAASGDGKSLMLQNLALNYIEKGHNVVFYSLELIPSLICKRFASMMTAIDIDFVYQHIDEIDTKVRHRGRTEGTLWLTRLPMRETTTLDVEAHYHDVSRETKTKYDIAIVDYVDIMYPATAGIKLGDIHLKDKYVAEEMLDFFHRNDLIGWTASQQVKGAQDEREARQSGVAGGQPKVATADNVIIMKRSVDDMADERIWGHVSKGRSGGVRTKVPFSLNSRTLRMGSGSEHDFYEANPWLFGKKSLQKDKRSDRVRNDPLAGPMSARASEGAEKPNQDAVSSSDGRSAIMKRLEAMRTKQEGATNGNG